MLYQASGRRLSSRTNFTWSDISRSSPSSDGSAGVWPTRPRRASGRLEPPMGVLTSDVVRDETFERRRASMEALVAELRERTALVAAGGGERAVERHRSRGKLHGARARRPARRPRHGVPRAERARRVGALRRRRAVAPGSSRASASSRGAQCVIVANDATVKGGTYYPLTVKKHLRAQEVARAEPPAVHLPRRLGRRVPARCRPRSSPTATTSAASSSTRRGLSALGIPQIAVVMGSCTAGGAYVPAMCGRDRDRAGAPARSSSAARRS